MPPQKQRDASLHEQLTEAPFLHEDDHAVEDQHHHEEVGHPLVGGHVVVVQQIE